MLEPGEIYKTGVLNFQVQVSSGTPQALAPFYPRERKGKVIRPEDGYSVYPFTVVEKNNEEEPEKTVPVEAGNIKSVITTCGMNVPIANLGVRIEYERQNGIRRDQLTSGVIARIAQASGERPYPGGESNQWHDWRHSVRQLYFYRVIKS